MSSTTLFPMPATSLPEAWPACISLEHAARQLSQSAADRGSELGVEVLDEIDSTNSELMRRARAGLHARTLLVAKRQSAGRGRLGREWHTQDTAALTMSLGLPMAPRDWSGLSLVVGLVLAQQLGHGVGIKWPNDLWHEQRKLCGILVETAGLNRPGETAPMHDPQAIFMPARYVVVGMGVNLQAPPSDGLRTPPVGLSDLLPPCNAPKSLFEAAQIDLGACAMAHVLPALLGALAEFEQHGFAPFETAYAQLDVLSGQRVHLSDGRTGLCMGVNARGAMLVHIDNEPEPQAIDTGEISIRPLAAQAL